MSGKVFNRVLFSDFNNQPEVRPVAHELKQLIADVEALREDGDAYLAVVPMQEFVEGLTEDDAVMWRAVVTTGTLFLEPDAHDQFKAWRDRIVSSGSNRARAALADYIANRYQVAFAEAEYRN